MSSEVCMSSFDITKRRAHDAGACMKCGAGQRGPVSVYVFRLGILELRLCLNCIKLLRIEIGELLGVDP